MKTVLFYQHFGLKGVVRGAHHKTFDFFNHIKNFENYKPVIYFDEDSIWDENLPWFDCFEVMPTIKELKTEPDILFLNSGKDWIKYSAQKTIPDSMPIISPVNNFRAVKPGHKSYDFLSRKAIRLCPSRELYEATYSHPDTNGETIFLPNGVGIFEEAQNLTHKKIYDILIVGNKNPTMASQLLMKLTHLNLKIEVIDGWIGKQEFQIKLAQSHLSVHLPKQVEEHYIPGVEAMMLDSLVIIPDCVGNRSYSKHMETCFVSAYDVESMVNSISSVFNLNTETKKQILNNAKNESTLFSLENESKVILSALKMTEDMW
jgi:hypothetical protein